MKRKNNIFNAVIVGRNIIAVNKIYKEYFATNTCLRFHKEFVVGNLTGSNSATLSIFEAILGVVYRDRQLTEIKSNCNIKTFSPVLIRNEVLIE